MPNAVDEDCPECAIDDAVWPATSPSPAATTEGDEWPEKAAEEIEDLSYSNHDWLAILRKHREGGNP